MQIYWKAVHDALKFNEFFEAKELDVADELLKEGDERATQLASGEAPGRPPPAWSSAVMSRVLTVRFNRMGWSFPILTSRRDRCVTGSTSGFMAAASN